MEDKELDNLMQASIEYKYTPINRKKVLSLIGQAQHIMITKNLDKAQIDGMISNISQLLVFVQKDHYPKRLLEIFKGDA